MSGLNPQGVVVHSFKTPSAEGLDHDFLWRCARRLPARGQIGIFNPSHYEEVLVVRVHPQLLESQRLPPGASAEDLWERRYREINSWERYLVDNGFRLVKLFLNLSREEQRKRFLKRIDLPEKNWKFSASDVNERSHWDQPARLLGDAHAHQHRMGSLARDPGRSQMVRACRGARVLAQTLMDIDPQYPSVEPQARQALEEVRVNLEAEAPVKR